MNLSELFFEDKPLQTKKIFSPAEAVIAIQIKAGDRLKEHITTVPAMLVCVTGEVVFENEKDVKEILVPGGYVNIESNIKHWITAEKDSNLLLIK